MKTTLALLAASTALGLALSVALTDVGSASVPQQGALAAAAAPQAAPAASRRIQLADNDETEGHEGGRSRSSDDHDDDEGCEDDGGQGCGPVAAPAGTVAPPANGLFGTGTGPKVRLN